MDVAGIAGGNYQGNTNLSDKGIALYSLELEGWLPSPMNYVADAIITTSIDDSSLDYGYGLNVTNHSYGFDPNDFQFIDTNFTLIREATHFANRAKVTFVASRGNNGNDDEFFPATIDDNWILNVGGSGRDGEYCEPANCGVIISLSYGRGMDMIAPASSDMIMTTHIGTPWVVSAGYTSSAAPHVTGVVGLLMSYLNDVGASYNNLAPEDCEQILQLSAEDMGTPQYPGYDDESGHGKLDAEAALRLVEKPYNKLLHFGTSDQISTIQKSINMISTGDSIKVTERFQKNDGTWLLADKYTANTYRIDCTVSHPLLATDSIRAFWPRHSSSSPFEHFDSDGTLFPRERIKIDACTATTCQMSGYIYNVFDENGNDIGWIPFPPSAISDAQFEYTILAKDRTVDVSKIEETQKLPIYIYPNPSSDKVSIEIYARSIGSLKIRLCDIQGRIIEYIFDDKVNEGSNTVSHNIEKLPSGVYLYEIQLGNQITHEKIIKL